MPVAGSVRSPFHWYSNTVPTEIVIRLAEMMVVGEQLPPAPTTPYATLPVVADWSVAQLIATCRPTRSVR